MHLRQILWNIKRAVILPWICTEPSNLQVKFHSKIAFHDWCYWHYRYFILRLIRVTLTKFWWNELTSSRTRYFVINSQFYLNFSKVKPFCPYFRVMLTSVFVLFYFPRKVNFFEISKCCFFYFTLLFLWGWRGERGGVRRRIISDLFKDIKMYFLQNVNSLLCSIKGKRYENLNAKSSLNLYGLWNCMGRLKIVSFPEPYRTL